MAEKEYIEREAIQKRLNRIVEVNNLRTDLAWFTPYGVKALIEEIPAADVRPVVLCRDCDCWNDWDSAGRESLGNYVCSCAHWSVEDGPILYTSPTDFCSYGEKREES